MPLAITAGGKDTSVPPESVLKLAKEVQARNPFVLLDYREKCGHETNYAASRAAYDFVINASPVRAARAALTLNGNAILPAHASTAGVWFYADMEGERPREPQGQSDSAHGDVHPPDGYGSQILLTGHTTVPQGWRLTASLKEGDEMRLVLEPGWTRPGRIGFRTETLAGQPPTCQVVSNVVTISADKGAGAALMTGLTAETCASTMATTPGIRLALGRPGLFRSLTG